MMTTVRDRGELVRKFLITNVEKHPSDIVKVAAEKFSCTRQAIHKHLTRLVEEGAVLQEGKTRSKVYRLAPLVEWHKEYLLNAQLTEDFVWRSDVAPLLGKLPENALSIWHYGFTEMFNNAIDHSEGNKIAVGLRKTAANTTISLYDNGVGIFKKIQAALGLLDERHSVLELAKGKFTTDPANHSGEGIFFTSRMFDDFHILAGGVYFAHEFQKKEDWILQPSTSSPGTFVEMTLNNHTSRTTKKVFDKFTTGDDYGFTKTVVPVKLTRYGDDNLVSRSQAKRLLARIDRFKVVVFDFSGVTSIGQAFADEVFRVFTTRHPEVEIIEIKVSAEVRKMISRARSRANDGASNT
jgi:anti-sigma regulatory factor (Ser/Thr protein kinase)